MALPLDQGDMAGGVLRLQTEKAISCETARIAFSGNCSIRLVIAVVVRVRRGCAGIESAERDEWTQLGTDRRG